MVNCDYDMQTTWFSITNGFYESSTSNVSDNVRLLTDILGKNLYINHYGAKWWIYVMMLKCKGNH